MLQLIHSRLTVLSKSQKPKYLKNPRTVVPIRVRQRVVAVDVGQATIRDPIVQVATSKPRETHRKTLMPNKIAK